MEKFCSSSNNIRIGGGGGSKGEKIDCPIHLLGRTDTNGYKVCHNF